jgi:hypothetical protein
MASSVMEHSLTGIGDYRSDAAGMDPKTEHGYRELILYLRHWVAPTEEWTGWDPRRSVLPHRGEANFEICEGRLFPSEVEGDRRSFRRRQDSARADPVDGAAGRGGCAHGRPWGLDVAAMRAVDPAPSC